MAKMFIKISKPNYCTVTKTQRFPYNFELKKY
jgi:hypothetical protein